jgi:hypothetical protein
MAHYYAERMLCQQHNKIKKMLAKSMQPAKIARMKSTIEEIRRSNLEVLVAEFKSAAAVARAAGTSRHNLSQISTQFKNKNGKVAVMGSTLARQLEAGCGKPLGWMDVSHDEAEENELTELYEKMSEEMRAILLAHARLMINQKK